jgi:hypothetical protein
MDRVVDSAYAGSAMGNAARAASRMSIVSDEFSTCYSMLRDQTQRLAALAERLGVPPVPTDIDDTIKDSQARPNGVLNELEYTANALRREINKLADRITPITDAI